MSFFQICLLVIFIVPMTVLCVYFALCVSWMEMQQEQKELRQRETAQTEQLRDVQRRYAKIRTNRRYVRLAGAMARAAQ